MIPISFQYRFETMAPRISIPADSPKKIKDNLIKYNKMKKEDYISVLWDNLSKEQKLWWIENH
jgi:hypothetical protein